MATFEKELTDLFEKYGIGEMINASPKVLARQVIRGIDSFNQAVVERDRVNEQYESIVKSQNEDKKRLGI